MLDNILSPKETKIIVFEKQITIKPLSLKQTLMLGEILGSISEEIKTHFKEKDISDAQTLMQILNIAGYKKAGGIINILLNWQIENKTDCEISQEISLQEISSLTKALAEVNDFKEIFINFTTALEKLKI